MNYYERIQCAIDYIDAHLEDNLTKEEIAAQAFMSVSSFYRLFFALTGHTVKEYLNRRRMSLASTLIIQRELRILDIALKTGFDSHEAFTRAFKRFTGYSPRQFLQEEQTFIFERMNIMNKYYDEQDPEMQEKYPDIVVIKDLSEMTVVSARYVGKNPEQNALSIIQKWFNNSGLSVQKDALRIFGFNNPNPKNDEDQDYGYEFIVTVPDTYKTSDKTVEVKTFSGGKYAVCGISGYEGNADGAGIPEAWDKLSKWLADSKYVHGHHQWLEEHLNFSEDFSFEGGMDLYMPIKLK